MREEVKKVAFECIECGHLQAGRSDRDGVACEKCRGHANAIGWWGAGASNRNDDQVNSKVLTAEVSIKDTSLFRSLCEIAAYLLEKADQGTRDEAVKRMVAAGIIEEPAVSILK